MYCCSGSGTLPAASLAQPEHSLRQRARSLSTGDELPPAARAEGAAVPGDQTVRFLALPTLEACEHKLREPETLRSCWPEYDDLWPETTLQPWTLLWCHLSCILATSCIIL